MAVLPAGEAMKKKADGDAIWPEVIRLIEAGKTRQAVAEELGLKLKQVQNAVSNARKRGHVVPDAARSASLWVMNKRHLGALTVGSLYDLIDALGIDTIKKIVAELPRDVSLSVYLAGIIKDALADESL